MLRRADCAAGSGVFRRIVSIFAPGEQLCHTARPPRGTLLKLSYPASTGMVSVARGVHLDACRSYASGSMVKFLAPPEELEDRYFERPTPILLVAGEGQSTDW